MNYFISLYYVSLPTSSQVASLNRGKAWRARDDDKMFVALHCALEASPFPQIVSVLIKSVQDLRCYYSVLYGGSAESIA